ncbi:MAG TPA: hypothetical protein VJ851_14790 [Jatrophihabitans sp.]|nr:hypothetical protein [Jatrophihabitans sp.]
MPNRDQARPRSGPRRVILFGVATALGVAAVCLVVFGTTQKQLQVGVLLGLWAGLIAAFSTFGARRGQLVEQQAERLAEAESRANQLTDAQIRVSELQRQLADAAQARDSQQVELRKMGDVELARQIAARREADHNLELAVRREIEHLMSEHIGALRSEVAALRAEVVDKLGGQLRLERIETTRLIGSDLEAIQHEIRRLASNQQDDPASSRAAQAQDSQLSRVDSSVAGAARWRLEQPAEIVDAEVIEGGQLARNEVNPAVHRYEDRYQSGRPDQAWSQPTAFGSEPAYRDRIWSDPMDRDVPAAHRPRSPEISDDRSWLPESADDRPSQFADPTDQPLDRPDEQADPASPFSSADPFAGLPRLSPLPPDVELIPDAESAGQATDAPDRPGRRRAPEDDDEHDRYHGRRRAEAMADSMAAASHSDGVGRRRAPEDDLAW